MLVYEVAGMLGIMGLIVLILYVLTRRTAEYRVTIPTPALGESERPLERVTLSRDEEAVLNYLVERVEAQ